AWDRAHYSTATTPPHGSGRRAFTTVPSGACTYSGRNAPELMSPPGSRKDLRIVNAPVGAIAGPTFVGPAVWGAVPVRSTVTASRATVTVARTRSGSRRSRPPSRYASFA